MSFLTQFEARPQPRLETATEKLSEEYAKARDLQRLTLQQRYQQQTFGNTYHDTYRHAIMAYEAQINTLKQALLLEQRSNMQLQRQVAELKQYVEQTRQAQHQQRVGVASTTNYETELLKRDYQRLDAQFKKEHNARMNLQQENKQLREKLMFYTRSDTYTLCPKDSQAIAELRQSASCAEQQMYHELCVLRAECRMYREQLEQLQQLGMSVSGTKCQRIPIPMNLDSLFAYIIEKLADMHAGSEKPPKGSYLDRVLKMTQKLILGVVQILASVLNGQYYDWHVGVAEAISYCEDFYVSAGGLAD